MLRAPETLFDSNEFGLPAFGWNFPNIALAGAFAEAARDLPNLKTAETTVEGLERTSDGWRLALVDGSTVTARLVVAADGKKSGIRAAAGFKTREHAFSQSALVADLELSRPLDGTSVEFHYPNGPFTLVPAGERKANLVWIDEESVLRPVREAGEAGLRAAALDKSQRLFGDIKPLTPSFIFPLSTLSVDRAGHGGIVLVGESAHAFPPIGAQGLNLGLRDVADLAAALAAGASDAPSWAADVSTAYADRRATDLQRTGGMVDTLFRSLLSEHLPAQAARAAGLWALKLVPPLRRRAVDIGMGARA